MFGFGSRPCFHFGGGIKTGKPNLFGARSIDF